MWDDVAAVACLSRGSFVSCVLVAAARTDSCERRQHRKAGSIVAVSAALVTKWRVAGRGSVCPGLGCRFIDAKAIVPVLNELSTDPGKDDAVEDWRCPVRMISCLHPNAVSAYYSCVNLWCRGGALWRLWHNSLADAVYNT